MGIVRAPLLLNEPSGQVIKGSLKFEKSASNYLSRTFSAGNRKTFTVSFWHKHSNHSEGASVGSGGGRIFTAGTTGAGARAQMGFSGPSNGSDEDNFSIGFNATGSTWKSLNSDAFFRDFSAWQHFVIAVDCNLSEPNRVKFYCNGVEKLLSGSFPGDENQQFNNNVGHAIGRYNPEGNDYYSGLLSNFYHIDGLYLGPEYFGFTDPLTGTWRPKKFKAVGTTVNDGTDWSANFSGNGGTQPSTAFDGNGPRQNGYVHSGSELTVNFSPPLSGHIIVYGGTGAGSHNPTTTDTFTLSDGSVLTSQEKYDVAPYFSKLDFGEKKNITSLVCSAGYTLYAVSVDGVFLKDSTTQNLDFGTNGFYLPMENQDDFEKDKSGNANDFTKNNFSGTSIDPDVIKDSPSGAVSGGRAQTGITTTSSAPANYATLNPVNQIHGTLSDGNLEAQSDTSGQYSLIPSTLLINKTGKFYWEVKFNTGSTDDAKYATIGICSESRRMYTNQGLTAADNVGDYAIKGWDGGFRTHTNQSVTYNYYSNHSNTLNNNDVVSLAFNADNGKLWFGLNGTYLTNAAGVGNPSLDLNPDLTAPTNIGHYPAFGAYNSDGQSSELHVNFGQKPFKYEPPKGFLPLNSATVRPNKVIPRPDQYVGIITYVGDDATSHSIKGLNFNAVPDFVWIKNRDQSEKHVLHDTVRGVGNTLYSSSTSVADTGSTYSDRFKSFDYNGFTVGTTHTSTNSDGDDFVAWCWKAGGSKGTFNIDDVAYASASAAGLDGGSITPTGASIGTKQGFSILKYSGASGTKSISHGLSQAPTFIIVKCTAGVASQNWTIYHKDLVVGDYLKLTTGGRIDYPMFNDSTPNSSTIPLGNDDQVSGSSGTYILYAWHDVPGLQKFGVYKGNNSNDGTVIELGFRPALVIQKRITSDHSNGGWYIYDSSRDPINPAFNFIVGESSYAERRASNNSAFVSTYYIDFLSNGFKMRNNATNANRNDIEYIYMAWAEAPAFNLFGGQSNAR